MCYVTVNVRLKDQKSTEQFVGSYTCLKFNVNNYRKVLLRKSFAHVLLSLL